MLNTTAPIVESPLVCTAQMAPPGASQAGDDQAFAKALDQAAAQQRDAAGDATEAPVRQGPRARPDGATHGRSNAAERRPATGSEPRKTEPIDSLTAASIEDSEVAPDDGLSLLQSPSDAAAQPAPDEPDAALPDLAAWASSLPLPLARPASAAATATAGARTQAVAAATVAAITAQASSTSDVPDTANEPIRNPGVTTAPLATALASTAVRQADARVARTPTPGLGDVAAKLSPAEADVQAVTPLPSVQRAGLDAAAALTALPGSWTQAQQPLADGSAPLQAEVQPPVGSNDFAPALGSRLSVMVRDGIDHAQLKLNPAEMGPIEVRISLDGTQAQVDFSAAHASTRQALQDALPALAGALRDQGLTLAGGGVFDQTREQRGDTRPDGARGPSGRPGAASEAGLPAAAAARVPRARGVVDLYA